MNLREWLKLNNISQTKLADDFGCSRSYISNIIDGRCPIGKKPAKKIEEYTNGEVTRLEILYPEEY